jgi:hypothetical protein
LFETFAHSLHASLAYEFASFAGAFAACTGKLNVNDGSIIAKTTVTDFSFEFILFSIQFVGEIYLINKPFMYKVRYTQKVIQLLESPLFFLLLISYSVSV